MTGKIVNIQDGKVTIRIDNGQSILIPIADVTYDNPQIGDRVSLRQSGNQWEVFKSNSSDPVLKRSASSGKRYLPAIIGILAVIIVLIAVMNIGKVTKKTAASSSVQKISSNQSSAVSDRKAASSSSSASSTYGVTATISSPQSESANGNTAGATENQQDNSNQQDLKIVDSGYLVDGPNQYSQVGYVRYAAVIKNTSSDTAATYPQLTVTAKSADGSILGSQDALGTCVMPNDTIALSGIMDIGSGSPKNVEFSVSAQSYSSASNMNIPKTSDFKVDNVAEKMSYSKPKVTGQVTYTGNQPCSTICVTALFKKDGKIVCPGEGYVYNVSPNTPMSFEIDPMVIGAFPAYDKVEVTAEYFN